MKYRFGYCIVLYTHRKNCAYAYTFICCSDASFGRRRGGGGAGGAFTTRRRAGGAGGAFTRRRRGTGRVQDRRNLQLEDSFADTSVEGELKDQDYYNAEEN